MPEERWNDASAIEAEGHPRIFFQKVPEAKTVKNRVHIDLLAGGGPSVPLDEQRERVAAQVARLEALGATRVDSHADLGVHWVVMRDPEGNEFCVSRAPAAVAPKESDVRHTSERPAQFWSRGGLDRATLSALRPELLHPPAATAPSDAHEVHATGSAR